MIGSSKKLRNKYYLYNTHTNSNITIIISHLDSDHWHRIYDDKNAYTCSWFIPNPKRKILFNHKVAEIIVNGGSVEIVKNDIFLK